MSDPMPFPRQGDAVDSAIAAAAAANPPGAGELQMVEFRIDLPTGRFAMLALPAGVTAVEMLNLIGQLPALGSQASRAGRPPDPRSRILVPR